MAKELSSEFFKVLGTIFSVAVTLLWIMVTVRTMKRVWTGDMFFGPVRVLDHGNKYLMCIDIRVRRRIVNIISDG